MSTFEVQKKRWLKADKIKSDDKVILPRLADWNYDPCEHHEVASAQCEYRQCGFEPFDHQTVSAAYHLIAKKSIDASETGTGKTNSILLTLCLAKHQKERLKAVLVVPTTAVRQWSDETQRFAPGLKKVVASAELNKDQRRELYASDWEVLIIGFHLMTRDIEDLKVIAPAQVVSDDVDPILQMKNKTHKAFMQLCEQADRVIIANATNLQTRLVQLYAASLPLGGRHIWGNEKSFDSKYTKREPVLIFTSSASGGKKRPKKVFKATGYKNLEDFKSKFNPLMIRHRYENLSDIRIPEIVTESVYLELYGPQRAKYEELQQGVLTLMKKDQPPAQKKVAALAIWTHGAQICAGLPALGEADGEFASSKLDWTVSHITGEWIDRKIVVYARNRGTIEALQARLDSEGVGHAAIWGGLTGSDARAAERKRFLEEPNCRVMIISAAGERSLNLQNASILVSIDMNLNPARVMQIMGRVRRIGSPHERVFAFNLLAVDTQEERYMLSLASRQALFDFIHDENHSDMFDALDAETLLKLISP